MAWGSRLLLALALGQLLQAHGRCAHEAYGVDPPDTASGEVVVGNYIVLQDGRPVAGEVALNKSKLFYYENFNVTTMNQPDMYRKLIISLEPCEGIVYAFVRKTRPCWPDPHTCCQPIPGTQGYPVAPPCKSPNQTIKCSWTHFHSIIDGTRDAAPTFFEVPHSSTKYFISVFAPAEANLNSGVPVPKFRLSVLTDIGAYPRPGLHGQVRTKQARDGSVEVSWDEATFIPIGVSGLRNYHLYSSLLLPSDAKMNEAVFLNPSKVMNSVCGLNRNAVRYGSPISPTSCHNGLCRAIISGILPSRRYMLNVIAESYRSFNSSYSGVIVSLDWSRTRHAFSDWSDTTTSLVGAIVGTVFGVLGIGYMWIVKLYK